MASPTALYPPPPASLYAAAFSLGPPAAVTVTRSSVSGALPLVWSPADCVRLRGQGGLAISPLGMCPLKVATNAKAAAVPALLSDEELYTGAALGWLVLTDTATGARLEPAALLAEALDRAGTPAARRRLVLRRSAFADLWARGYRMTSGIKFGVDYLAYRADPSTCHAAFMVRVMAEGAGMSPLDLVARSRVATTALKIAVTAYVRLDPVEAAAPAAAPPPPAAEGGEGEQQVVGEGAVPLQQAGDGGTGVVARVRYSAFKRMGPGLALFASVSSLTVPLADVAALADAEAKALRAAQAAADAARLAEMEERNAASAAAAAARGEAAADAAAAVPEALDDADGAGDVGEAEDAGMEAEDGEEGVEGEGEGAMGGEGGGGQDGAGDGAGGGGGGGDDDDAVMAGGT